MDHIWDSKYHKVSELSSQKILDRKDKSFDENFSKQNDGLTFFKISCVFDPFLEWAILTPRFLEVPLLWYLVYFTKMTELWNASTEKSFNYFFTRPKYVLHDMWKYCLIYLYAPKRHTNAYFWSNLKFTKTRFCA